MKKIRIKPLVLGLLVCMITAILQYEDYIYITSYPGGVQLGSDIGRISGYVLYFVVFIMSIMVVFYGFSLNSKLSVYGEKIYKYLINSIFNNDKQHEER